MNTANIVIALYGHPEAYPPTLNAIGELSPLFEEITIVHRPHFETHWDYAPNVQLIPSGELMHPRKQEALPIKEKIKLFYRFCQLLQQTMAEKQPQAILLYDPLAMFAYHVIRPFLKGRRMVWYHNHDMIDMKYTRKYSLGYWASKAETAAMRYLDVFSLPADERRKYFDTRTFKGRYFLIPNYPSRRFYGSFYGASKPTDSLILIYQGHVGGSHGIEQIVPLLGKKIGGRTIKLVLKGIWKDEYQQHINQLAEQHHVTDHLTWIGLTPYQEVPKTAASCHVGIGILAKQDIMNITLGAASNKLYEYAAVGLPILYYHSEHFKAHLGTYPWAFPVDVTEESIWEALQKIAADYPALSAAANASFNAGLNYETVFSPVKEFIVSRLKGL